MSISYGSGHQFFGLVGRIAKHDPLISRTLLGGIFVICGIGIHPLRDILRLLAEKIHEEKAIGIKLGSIAILGVISICFIVSDLPDRLASHLLIIKLGASRYLSGKDKNIVFHQSFTSHTGLGVLLKTSIKDSIGDSITDFVWVSFGDGF